MAIGSFDSTSLLADSDNQFFSAKSLQQLKNNLRHKLWEYLIIKLSEELTEDQLEQVLDTVNYSQKENLLKQFVPNSEAKINKHVEEFKQNIKDY